MTRRRRRRRGFLTRAVEAVLVTSHLYARPTGQAQHPAVAAPYEVRLATEADLARFESDLAGELRPGKALMLVGRARSPGIALFVVIGPDGRVCGFGHTEYGRVRDEHLGLDLGVWPGAAHLFDDYVSPEHRGHRLQAALLEERIAAAAESGAGQVTILVEDTNHASRASVQRAGFVPRVRVLTAKGPGRRRSWAWPRQPHGRQGTPG